MDYPHSNFCRVACCLASGYRSIRKYHYYRVGCEYAAGCFRYDLRYDVGALCLRNFAHYGEADWNRSALELDIFHRGRKHFEGKYENKTQFYFVAIPFVQLGEKEIRPGSGVPARQGQSCGC